MEKKIKSRVILKHETKTNWEASNFIPKSGELVLYDPDENYNYLRVKRGDGNTNINKLLFEPFVHVSTTEPTNAPEGLIWFGNSLIKQKTSDGWNILQDNVANLKYTVQNLTNTQQQQARTNINVYSKTDVYTKAEINYKILNETISYGSVIQNSNSFGGKKLYINSLDNVFASMEKKFWVMVTFHQCTDENNTEYPHIKDGATTADIDYWVDGPEIISKRLNFDNTTIHNLFDNNYDTSINIAANTYAKIHIRFSNNEEWTPANATLNASQAYGTYPYGSFYISYYYDRVPHTTKRSHYRCFNNIDAHGHGYGWKKLDFNYYLGNSSSTVNVIEYVEDGSNLNRSCIEFIVFGTSDTEKTHPDTWISQLEWKKDRVDFAKNSSILHNYGTNSVYHDMLFKTQTATNVSISPKGYIKASNYIEAPIIKGSLSNSLIFGEQSYNGSQNIELPFSKKYITNNTSIDLSQYLANLKAPYKISLTSFGSFATGSGLRLTQDASEYFDRIEIIYYNNSYIANLYLQDGSVKYSTNLTTAATLYSFGTPTIISIDQLF